VALLRATLNSTADGILVTDNERRLVEHNSVFAQMWNVPPGVLEAGDHPRLIQHVRPMFPDVEGFGRRVDEIYNSKEEAIDELRRKDGRVYERYSKILHVNGEAVGRVWSFRDVTRRTTAEEFRWRLAAIVESSNDAIISATLDGVITTWNAAAFRMFGYTAEEVIGKEVPMLYPSERKDAEAQILERIRRGERVDNYETQRVCKDGHRVMVSLSVSPIRDEAGHIMGMSKIARDITQQKRDQEALKMSEARLRAVLDATPESVTIVAPDGSILFVNQVGLEMIEAGPDVVGSSIFKVISPTHWDVWRENHERVCNGEPLTWEFEMIGCNGARRWMETHAVPLPMEDEGYTAQLAVALEITRRKQLELEREELLASERYARAQAERASQLKDEFLATLSHELRTPLNAIVGWSQILSMEPPSPTELEEGLEAIERNARAQTRIIEDLLDMSRIISGKVRLDVHDVDLASVIDAALAAVRPSADAKEITLRKILDTGAGHVAGDATRLQQVIWNLLSNAVKFTPKGGKIDVYLQRVNSHLEIVVRDSGIGIEADFLAVVFERFRQVDSSSTRNFGGLGLGLSIAKSLVELHGGTISVTSQGIGHGATFTVALPLAPLRGEGVREHPAAGGRANVIHDFDLAGIVVLVVDDESDARTLVSRMLSECGATVLTASGADEAIQLLAAEGPDVLVSDIGMPGKDGYQLIEQVRQLPEKLGGDTPAVALTAFARSEDRTRAIMAGYQIHISKPIEARELVATIASLAGRLHRHPPE
jgi:PAS domain S-box-containing protein